MHMQVQYWVSSRKRMSNSQTGKNGCSNLIDPSAIGSTQQEVLGM